MTSPIRRALLITPAAFLVCAVFLSSHRGAIKSPQPSTSCNCAVVIGLPDVFQIQPTATAPNQISSPSAPGEFALIRNPAQTPVWAIPFGAEFWRRHLARIGTPISPRGAASGLSPFQLGDAIDRVTHAFESGPAGETAEAGGRGFRARIDREGLALSPAGQKNEEATPVRFKTRRISQGPREFYRGEPSASGWCVTGNTAQSLLEPTTGLVAHYEVRASGVEVTWVVDRRLAEQGDLTIEAEITGARFPSPETSNNSSPEDANGPRMRVGPAFAVDQAGRSWQLAVVTTRHTLQVTVPASVLTEARFPLAVDPLISPEFALDGLADGPTPCTRATPVVAANKFGYFVAWSHGKSDITDAAVYGARVDATGTLLDPSGILISTQAGEQTVCAVAANDDMFLVAWAAPHGSSVTDWDILGARIQASGTVQDSTPLPICTVVSTVQNSPTAAANGESFFVAWRDARSTAIYGTIVGKDGSLSTTNGIILLNGTNDQYTPAAAALGTNYLVVAQDYRKATSAAYNSDIYGARVDGKGVLLDPPGFVICTNSGSQFNPAVASDGTNYLVVWQDYDLAGSDIAGARVSPEGRVLDTNSLIICHAATSQAYPAVAANNGTFLVAWQDYRNSPTNNYEARVYGARVTADGMVMDPEGVNLSPGIGGQYHPAVAARSGEWLAVWQDFRDNPGTVLSDVMGTRLNDSNGLTAAPEARLSSAANAQISPAVAALGSNYLAVWADNRHSASNNWDICGLRLNQGGLPLDFSPFWICSATNRQADPAVAAGQDSYFVTWSDWRNTPATLQHADIYGSVISAGGIVQQPDGIAICTVTNDQSLPAVAAFGTNFLVVWQDARLSLPSVPRMDIYGSRIAGNGTVLDPDGFAICTNAAIQTNPVVTATATRALVAWTDYRLSTTYPDIFGARVNPDGSVIETNGLRICTASLNQSLPAAASDASSFFVVWADSRNGAANAPDIYGAMINDEGVVSPTNGFAIRTGPGPQTAPAVAFNGRDYLVTWQTAPSSLSSSFDIAAVQISPEGPAGIGPIMLLDSQASSQASPAVAAGADGRFLVLNQGSLSSSRQTLANFVNPELVPRLDAPTVASNGQFQFRFRGAPGQRYAIESSDNLQGWTPLWTFTNSSPSSVFVDPATTNLPFRFYRATLIP
jgi:hypothetical protein